MERGWREGLEGGADGGSGVVGGLAPQAAANRMNRNRSRECAPKPKRTYTNRGLTAFGVSGLGFGFRV